MRILFNRLYLNRHFLGFVLLFAYAQSIQIRILVRQNVNIYTFTPEAALLKLFSACILFGIMGVLINRYKKDGHLNFSGAIKVFGWSLICFMVVSNLGGLCISLVFDTFQRNFNPKTLLNDNTQNALNVCIYGSFFLAYFFYRSNRGHTEQMEIYNYAMSENKIAQLKAQLNPHFLFNNLNVLDQLIEEDNGKASGFLNDFAELYRYVLEASDKKLVALEDEVSFAKGYFRIMQHKYGTGYSFAVLEKEKISGFIPPLTLQLLLENAIEHNIGSKQNPVCITVEIGDRVTVVNNVVQKARPKPFGGRSLVNLKEQYNLLSDEAVEVLHTETQFSISLPIILNQHKR